MRPTTAQSLQPRVCAMSGFWRSRWHSQWNDGGARIARKLFRHVLLIGNGMLDGACLEREVHELLKFRADHSKVAVGHPAGRILHHEANDLRILVEEFLACGDLDRLFAVL